MTNQLSLNAPVQARVANPPHFGKLPKPFAIPNLTNLIFSFLPVGECMAGNHLSKGVKLNFRTWQILTGNIEHRLFYRYLTAQAQGVNPTEFEMIQEIRKVAPHIRTMNAGYFDLRPLMDLLSSQEAPLFPALKELSLSFSHASRSLESSHLGPATYSTHPNHRQRIYQHCPKDLALKTLAKVGACCPQIQSLSIQNGEGAESLCVALIQGLVDSKGRHMLKTFQFETEFWKDATDLKALVDMCPNLEGVVVKQAYNHEPSLAKIAQLKRFSTAPMTGQKELEAFVGHPSLTSVDFYDGHFSNKGLEHLSKIPHLQHLSIRCSQQEPDFSCLANAKEFTTLHLKECFPKKQPLFKTLPPQILHLSVEGSFLFDEDLQLLGRCAQLRTLRLINTVSFSFGPDGKKMSDKGLSAVAACKELQTLSFNCSNSESQYTTAGIVALALDLPKLFELDLKRIGLPAVDVEKVAEALEEKKPQLRLLKSEPKKPKPKS